MKQFQVLISATAIVVLTALPVLAQFATTRIGGETALQMAKRVDACDGSRIVDASFVENDTQSISKYNSAVQLRVTCVDGMAGGLGAGAVAGIAATVIAIAIVASSGGGSSTPSTTN